MHWWTRWKLTTVTNKMMAISAISAALAACFSGGVAYEQYRFTQQSAQLDERPWLGVVESKTDTIEAGQQPAFHLKIQNFGKTPALGVHFEMGFRGLYRVGDEDSDSYDLPAEQHLKAGDANNVVKRQVPGPVPPTGTYRETISVGNPVLTPQMISDLQNGKLRFYVWGQYTYTDISHPHEPYRTKFCFRIGKEIGIVDDTGFTMHTATYWNDMS